MLEAYFIGLKEGAVLRNASLTAFGLVFIPLATTAWYLQIVDWLWIALISYMATLVVFLGGQMFKTQGKLKLVANSQ